MRPVGRFCDMLGKVGTVSLVNASSQQCVSSCSLYSASSSFVSDSFQVRQPHQSPPSHSRSIHCYSFPIVHSGRQVSGLASAHCLITDLNSRSISFPAGFGWLVNNTVISQCDPHRPQDAEDLPLCSCSEEVCACHSVHVAVLLTSTLK